MNKSRLILLLLMTTLVIAGCKRKNEPNKILEGVPVDATQSVIPALAIQQYLLLNRDAMGIIVRVINGLGITENVDTQLTSLGGAVYSFSVSNPKYGTCQFTVRFYNSDTTTPANIIDPFVALTSSTTLKAVTVIGGSISSEFDYTNTLTISLETQGNVDSTKRVTGTTNFVGSGYTIVFVLNSPGSETNIDGFVDGVLAATGTGGPNSSAMVLTAGISSDHSIDGTIEWEGQTGGIHMENNGLGFITTSDSRILVD